MDTVSAKAVFADMLDSAMVSMFSSLLQRQLSAFPAWSSACESWKSEVSALLEAMYFLLSVQHARLTSFLALGDKGSLDERRGTVGMQVMGLGWARKGSVLIYALLLSIKYSLAKLSTYASTNGWRDENHPNHIYSQLAHYASLSLKALQLAHMFSFLLFPVSITTPRLFMYLSGLRWVSLRPSTSSAATPAQLSLEYRKLLWVVLLGLGSAAMVSIDWANLATSCTSLVNSWLPSSLASPLSRRQVTDDDDADKRSGVLTCGICGRSPPENPHVHRDCLSRLRMNADNGDVGDDDDDDDSDSLDRKSELRRCVHCYLCLYRGATSDSRGGIVDQEDEDHVEMDMDVHRRCGSCGTHWQRPSSSGSSILHMTGGSSTRAPVLLVPYRL